MSSCRAAAVVTMSLTAALAGSGAAQSGFAPGTRTIYQMSFANLQPGELPTGITLLKGSLAVGSKDGKTTLVTNAPTEFLVKLPEALPPDFTVELEIAAKKCCNPEDLMIEGTLGRNRGAASAEVTWHPSRITVAGGGDMYQSDVPEDLGPTLRGTLSQVGMSYEAGTLKLYTNGRRLYTLSDRKFVRGHVLRLTLGGQDGPDYAVHLAGLRIASNSPTQPISVAGGFVPGTRTIWQMSFANLKPGELPRGIRLLDGSLGIGSKDGKPALVTNKPTQFVVQLPETLPADFTLEFVIAPKACCNPEDLMFEGTASRNRGAASAEVTWHPGHIMVVGGGEMYQSDVPEELGLTLPMNLTEVNAGYSAGTLKLYTNGRRLYTLADRKFARGKLLRIWLGGQDGADYAVHLTALRIATNSPKPLP